MAKRFTPEEWKTIDTRLRGRETGYGIPERRAGSLVLASWNIRKFGTKPKASAKSGRSDGAYEMVARFAANCDLMAIQECQSDLASVRWLVDELNRRDSGGEWCLIGSDITGEAPNEKGSPERMVFLWRGAVFRLADIVSDLSFDRSAVLNKVNANLLELRDAVLASPDTGTWEGLATRLKNFVGFDAPKLPKFFEFIRSPYLAVFETRAAAASPYRLACVDAHLVSGTAREREREFFALLEWLHFVCAAKTPDAPAYLLMGDLNLDFQKDNDARREAIAKGVKEMEGKAKGAVAVNFPFLENHPARGPIRTNSRLSQTFDHIAFFSRDARLPTVEANRQAGTGDKDDYDYGMFDFRRLFEEAGVGSFKTKQSAEELYAKFEFDLSDHMPIWIRLPLPKAARGPRRRDG